MSAGGQRSGSALFQLGVRVPGGEWVVVPLHPLPFAVGRSAQSSHVVSAPGVWDRHLHFEMDPAEGLIAIAESGAIVLHESQPVQRHRLRNGDQLQAGAALLQVLIAPPPRRSLRSWEFVLWGVLVLAIAGQVYSAIRLMTD